MRGGHHYLHYWLLLDHRTKTKMETETTSYNTNCIAQPIRTDRSND